jgi:hypothetical protein
LATPFLTALAALFTFAFPDFEAPDTFAVFAIVVRFYYDISIKVPNLFSSGMHKPLHNYYKKRLTRRANAQG